MRLDTLQKIMLEESTSQDKKAIKPKNKRFTIVKITKKEKMIKLRMMCNNIEMSLMTIQDSSL